MRFFFLIFCASICLGINAQDTGPNIHTVKDMASAYVAPRDVYIRLPEKYSEENTYPVLYMHDGQMLFSTQETWNGQNWGVDQTIDSLVNKGMIHDIIVVGIANVAAARHANYYPEKPFLSLPTAVKDSLLAISRGDAKLFDKTVNSDDYLKFLVFEVKPFIDQKYSTKTESEHTFIAGSSMGGLISMYAFFEYPEVFGGAACLSTHWIGGFVDNAIIPNSFRAYIEHRRGLIEGRKLYFDTGTETLDRHYGAHQQSIDALFNEQNGLNKYYLSKVFDGAAHTENDWKTRFHNPIRFLLQNE